MGKKKTNVEIVDTIPEKIETQDPPQETTPTLEETDGAPADGMKEPEDGEVDPLQEEAKDEEAKSTETEETDGTPPDGTEEPEDGVESMEFDPTQEAEYVQRVKARKTTQYEHISTRTGIVMVRPGFWIVEDMSGEKQAFREDVFLAKYDPAE